MSKLLAALIASTFATAAIAQTAAPAVTDKEKQADVKAKTEAAAASTTDAKTPKERAANVKASKEVAKMTAAEKKAFATELNKQMINPGGNPNNPTLRSYDDPRGKFGVDSLRVAPKQGGKTGDPSRR